MFSFVSYSTVMNLSMSNHTYTTPFSYVHNCEVLAPDPKKPHFSVQKSLF